jgi:pimeloyl-ACP methyl ester carboxylesterase
VTGKYVETNGIRLHYLDHAGDGPTLLLFPGLNANAVFFEGLAKAGLVPTLRVVSVDLRGRGLSDAPDTGYTMRDHAADIVGLLDHLQMERVALGGHSFGGLLSYYLAAEYPERVERIVVIDSPAEVSQTVVEQIGPALDRLRMVTPSWDEYLAGVKAMPYYAGWWDPDLEAYYRADVVERADGSIRSRLDPGKILQALEGTTTVEWMELAKRISAPVLLLRATEPFGPPGYPPILPKDQAQRTLASLSDARMIELAGNHITALFGKPARIAASAIVEFVTAGN